MPQEAAFHFDSPSTRSTVEPPFTIDDCRKPDILVIPGGNTAVLTGDPRFMSGVKECAGRTEILFSV